jgi:hypothetical protein
MVDQLETAANLSRTLIQSLTKRVSHLEDLLAGRVQGDVRVDGTLTATDVLIP